MSYPSYYPVYSVPNVENPLIVDDNQPVGYNWYQSCPSSGVDMMVVPPCFYPVSLPPIYYPVQYKPPEPPPTDFSISYASELSAYNMFDTSSERDLVVKDVVVQKELTMDEVAVATQLFDEIPVRNSNSLAEKVSGDVPDITTQGTDKIIQTTDRILLQMEEIKRLILQLSPPSNRGEVLPKVEVDVLIGSGSELHDVAKDGKNGAGDVSILGENVDLNIKEKVVGNEVFKETEWSVPESESNESEENENTKEEYEPWTQAWDWDDDMESDDIMEQQGVVNDVEDISGHEDSENCEKVTKRDGVSTLSVRKDTDMHDDDVNGASEEVKEHELTLSKTVDNVVSSIGDSMHLKVKKEKHREYADEYREKFSSDARNEMEEKGLQDSLIDKENRPSINVAPIGTGSKFGEKPFEEVEMLNYQKKVAVLYELLAACLVLKPDADSKSIQRRDGYDARHRVALRLLTAWLNINWINMEALETIIASSAMSTLKAEECTERKTQNKKDSWANWKRGSIIGAAALTGGTIFAITGGLAAPGIAEGFGALTPVSLHVAATAATTHIAVAASLGAAGAGLSGIKMASRIGNLEDFEFRVVGENNNQSRLAVEILISRFVFEEEDYIRPWEGQANNSERYALQWESKNLIAVSTAIQDWLTTQLTIMTMKQRDMLTVLHSLVSALAWPTALQNVLDLIDSKWSIAIDRSDQAGILLAEEVLPKGLHGQRPVTLIGFSLGARVIFKCLQTLAEAILAVDIGGESHIEIPMPKIRNRITVQIFDPGGCTCCKAPFASKRC